MNTCKHGLILEQCSYCNGDFDKRETELSKYRLERAERREYKIKWRTLQADSLSVATNHREELTLEILKVILSTIDGYTKQDIDVLYDVAIKVGRSLASICWIWNFAYGNYESLNIKEGEERKIYTKVQTVKLTLGL